MKSVARFLLIALGYLLAVNTAMAHNTLTASVPSDQALLTESPDAIQLRFSDATYLEGIELTTLDGKNIPLEVEPTQTAARQFTIPVPALGNDEYRVAWVVVGDDTHEIKGEFSFKVDSINVGRVAVKSD